MVDARNSTKVEEQVRFLYSLLAQGIALKCEVGINDETRNGEASGLAVVRVHLL